MKKTLGIFALLFASQSFAGGVDCNKPKDLAVQGDFCRISYQTLAQLQELQINGKVSADLNLAKMEEALLSNSIDEAELKADLWKKAKATDKANKAFTLMLKHTNQLDLHLHFVIDQTPMPGLAMGETTSTGTRGGGFGNETYILPQGFWIP